jgi:type I restriction enzyme S subunit
LEHLVPEEITVTAWDDGSDNTFTKMFYKGDVLFGRRRAYLKKAAVAPFDGICSGDITVIKAKPDRILPELLPFIIQNDTLFDYAVGKSAGSLSPRVKWEHLKNYEFELPDMDKQRELAELLWAMDTTKKSYQKLITATDELVKSQFIEMFGTATDSRYKVSTIGQECVLKSGTTFPSQKELSNGDVIYAKVADMNLPGNETYIQTSKTFVSIETAGKTIIPAGAIIFPKRGGAIGTNKKRILLYDTCVDLNTMGVIPGERLLTEYLFSYFQCIDLGNICDGSTIPQINNKNVSPLQILVPPISMQQEFSVFVRQIDKSKFELEQALAELTATYKRIIKENLG